MQDLLYNALKSCISSSGFSTSQIKRAARNTVSRSECQKEDQWECNRASASVQSQQCPVAPLTARQ